MDITESFVFECVNFQLDHHVRHCFSFQLKARPGLGLGMKTEKNMHVMDFPMFLVHAVCIGFLCSAEACGLTKYMEIY